MNFKTCTALVLLATPLSTLATVAPPSTAVCDALAGCSVGSTLYDGGNVTIYSGTSAAGNVFWAGYDLGTSSTYYNPGGNYNNYVSSTVQLTGTLWIEAPISFTSSSAADQIGIIPASTIKVYAPSRLGDIDTYEFTLDEEALATSTGFDYFNGEGDLAGHIPTRTGNMEVQNYFSCVECGWNMDLNLINLQYVGGPGFYNLQVNPIDNRELIFRNETTYYIDDIYTYSLTNVPVPGAAWLFGSALLGLFGFGRAKRN